MDARSAADLVRFLEQNNLEVYVDGGWAVDALLGTQTRPHDDLDIAIPHKYVPALRALLSARGFREWPLDGSWECNFVLADEEGHRLDVHSYTLDSSGINIFGVGYIGEDLSASGSIDGYAVRCICARSLVKFHTGYALDENDYHDVRLLCDRFGLAMPEEYRRFIA
jgi:lincosamide nucleotidyltransferase A/C/D/E